MGVESYFRLRDTEYPYIVDAYALLQRALPHYFLFLRCALFCSISRTRPSIMDASTLVD